MKKILITGGSGLLGSYAAVQAVEAGWETYATYSTHPVEIPGCQMLQVDLRDLEQTVNTIADIKPQVILHTAAIAKPDICEQRRRDAFEINVTGTINVIHACEKVGAHLVHISSDMVFSGDRNPIHTTDTLSPTSYYGLTKAAAETAIYASDAEWAIVRTSLIYGPCIFPFNESYSDKVLNSLMSGKPIGAFIDQYRPAIPAWNLADAVLEIADRRLRGIYHVACPEIVTRYQFAIKLAQAFGLDETLIEPVCVDSTRAIAHRPKMLVLDTIPTAALLNTRLLTFEEGIRQMKERMDAKTTK